ncbi:hypothetical protein Clacol_000201 [Clathrus columnatus]|uniref:Uncharacterized protein n=1 Tax=Clathrus columnatus TaxID=1419009 RepID=A0AAV4ZWC3_9AGAM|nr:hypothetical protein Clacol_000201 [Clathrus columnatus]
MFGQTLYANYKKTCLDELTGTRINLRPNKSPSKSSTIQPYRLRNRYRWILEYVNETQDIFTLQSVTVSIPPSLRPELQALTTDTPNVYQIQVIRTGLMGYAAEGPKESWAVEIQYLGPSNPVNQWKFIPQD